MRPRSIIAFERVYMACILLGLVQIAVGWNAMTAAMQQSFAHVPDLPPSFGSDMLIGAYVIGLVIQLLLWFFIARRGSDVARWILVILFALAVLGMLRTLTGGFAGATDLGGLSRLLSIIGFVLYAIAVSLLFRADAKPWFGNERA